MKLSKKGLDLIKQFESYLKKQPDGSCTAYQCPAGRWTCGWGCTEGVGPLTQWSLEEATEALAHEMAKHERVVERLVKVPLTQGQFDALVSFSYNTGGLEGSTLLKHLNKGDYARAASHFADWKKARVHGSTAKFYKVKDGTLVTLPGLVTRRAAEAQLFLESAPVEMPQAVAPEATKMKPLEAMMKVGAPVLAVGEFARQSGPYIPSVPPQFVETVANLGAWKGLLMQVGSLGSEAAVAGGSGLAAAAGVYLYARKWFGAA
jgi:lysozyme